MASAYVVGLRPGSLTRCANCGARCGQQLHGGRWVHFKWRRSASSPEVGLTVSWTTVALYVKHPTVHVDGSAIAEPLPIVPLSKDDVRRLEAEAQAKDDAEYEAAMERLRAPRTEPAAVRQPVSAEARLRAAAYEP